MKIYDCFTFYNEFDLLELRLTELYEHVDQFVIVEANQTFTNKPKDFNFEQHQARYAKWMDKIRYIRVEDMPGDSDPWVNETHQRNAIARGLDDAEDDDIIIISDCDEIIRGAAVDHIRNSEASLFALRMPLYNFKFNYMRVSQGVYDVWAMAVRHSLFADIDANTLRGMRFQFTGAPLQFSNDGCELIEHSGWHFGYMGDNKYLQDKAQSFSHQNVNTPEFLAQIDIESSIAEKTDWGHNGVDRYEIVDLDNYFPKAAANYTQFILPDSGIKSLALLPTYTYNS
jgi:Glycosyltransferase family 17